MKKIKLGKLIKVIHGFAFDISKYIDKSEYRLVTLGNFKEGDNSFNYNDAKAKYTSECPEERFILKEGDLILPLTEQVVGLFGNTAFVPKADDYKFVLNQRVGKIEIISSEVDKNYLHYLLACSYVKKQLEDRASGTKQRNISPDDVYDVQVELPNIETQVKVGELLRSVEDKIAINNAINDNLQQLIQFTYDYWFLLYEFPNQDGKPYKSNNGEFKWNSRLKRKIPIDWEVCTLRDVLIETKIPFDYQSVQPTIDLSVMPSGSISLSQLNESTMFQTNLFKMEQGDLLFGSIRPYLLKAGIAPCDGVVAGTVHSYKVKNNNYYNLALCLLTNKNMFNYAVKTSGGTKMPVVSSDNILDYPFAFSPKIALLFNEVGIAEQICKNVQEINALTKLREYLLPLLMNGQITIAD